MSGDFLKHPGFHLLMFFFFLSLFNWPILSIAETPQDQTLIYYLFWAWLGLVMLLLLIARSLNGKDSSPE